MGCIIVELILNFYITENSFRNNGNALRQDTAKALRCDTVKALRCDTAKALRYDNV
ncbi:MAG: hypothetical protein K0S01_2687 [Herbinix sp.]|jgi:hypothetical protein|nr:hypothetical protein [Herbinix sp.]